MLPQNNKPIRSVYKRTCDVLYTIMMFIIDDVSVGRKINFVRYVIANKLFYADKSSVMKSEDFDKIDMHYRLKTLKVLRLINKNSIMVNDSNTTSETGNTHEHSTYSRVQNDDVKTPRWFTILAVIILVLVIVFCLWKWRLFMSLVTWPYKAVTSSLATNVTVTQTTGGTVSLMLSNLGLMTMPQVIVTKVSLYWYHVLAALVAEVMYLTSALLAVASFYHMVRSFVTKSE